MILNVIVFIRNLFLWASQILHGCLIITLVFGELIYKLIYLFLKCVILLFDKIYQILNVLYEDYFIFLNDVTYMVNVAAVRAEAAVDWLLSTGAFCADLVLDSLDSLLALASLFYSQLTELVHFLLLVPGYVQSYLILLGSGIWLAFKSLPLFLFLLFEYSFTLIGAGVYLLYLFLTFTLYACHDSLFDIIHFFAGFPLDALLGLALASLLLYLIFKKKIFTYFYKTSVQYLFRNPIRRRNCFKEKSEEQQRNNETLLRELQREREESLCVICHDNKRSIILLPCKHLCLCDLCAHAILRTRMICPICRAYIHKSLQVYM